MTTSNEIFITGTTGIAGGFAAEKLHQRAFRLKLLVRKLPSTPTHDSYQYVLGDLNQLALLDQLSRDNNGIVHYAFASLRGRADPQVDIDAMTILLKNWEHGPFTFISSVDVYGFQRSNIVIDESHPLSGEINAYAVGKVACETLLMNEAKRRGRNDFTILRAPWIFAPNALSKQHILNRFVNKFNHDILLPGKTKSEYENYVDCWIDARDLAWLAAESIKKPLGGAGNAIAGKFCWHDFFRELISIAKINKAIRHTSHEEAGQYAAELFGQKNHFSGEKIINYFQFNPQYQLHDTLQSIFSIA